ncbi:MAG: membrane-bound lytic murein transglycosylase B [Arenicella sp.]|jgi:membrane-bound lytic murein transglycosylase B
MKFNCPAKLIFSKAASALAIKTVLSSLVLTILWSSAANAVDIDKHPKLMEVADQLIAENYYSQGELTAIFEKADFQQSVLDAMQSPAEYKLTWGKYRKIFLQQDRITQGAEFWLQYLAELERAEKEYGVPASVIVSIIGVESKFGKYKGSHKVLDSLVTLVVGFERRSKFFASELKQFLILTKENKLLADEILGSYAGAVGFPQFISSSYRNYAVDFSGDGLIDLINQPVDAIGSIANYFVRNGWLSGQPVTSLAHPKVPVQVSELANNKRKVQYKAGDLRALGAQIGSSINDSEKLGVIELNASEVVAESSDKKTYVVRAGDTACEIAEAHLVACKTLIKLNKLKNSGAVYRGQELKVPSELRADVAKSQVKTKAITKTVRVSSDSKWRVAVDSDSKALPKENVIEQNGAQLLRYFFTHENFYVITRYNQSVLYAMAVHDLSVAITSAKQDLVSASMGNLQ